MEERTLTADEIERFVTAAFALSGNPLPDPSSSSVVGLIRDKEVLAYLCLQLKVHAQPLRIFPGHEALFPRLVRAAEKEILDKIGPSWIYLFAPQALVKMASAMGMQLEPWHVMSKLVHKPDPIQPIPVLESAERTQ